MQRVRALPRETQRLLLVAAAEPVGDVSLLWRAAEQLGIRGSAGRPAEDGRVDRPRDPGAVPASARPLGRLPGGSRLAIARRCIERWPRRPTREPDPDRRAWHRAHAAAGPDEAVAAELERSADRAQRRGGVAAAAAFLERAAELTPDPARRGARALAAAQAKLEAGSRETAQELLATADLTPLDELQRAGLQRLRAQIAFVFTRGSDGPLLLLDAAQTARSARSRVGASDLPRGARSGYVRRTRQRRLRCAGGRRGGPSRARGAAAAAIDRPRPRRHRDAGARRGPAMVCRRSGSQSRRSGTRLSMVTRTIMRWLLLTPIVQSMTVFELWDDDAFHAARHPRRAAGPRYRRARPAPGRARLQVRRAPVRRGTRGGRGRLSRRRTRLRPRPATQAARTPGLSLAAWRGVEAEARSSSTVGLESTTARSRGQGGGAGRLLPARCSTTAWAATRRRWTAQSSLATMATSVSGAALPNSSRPRLVLDTPEVAAAALARLEDRTLRRRHGLGARNPGTLTSADDRRRGRGRLLP